MQEKLPLHLNSSHNKHWMKFILQALAVESLAPQQKRLKMSLGTSHRGTSFIPWINRSFGSTKRMEAGVSFTSCQSILLPIFRKLFFISPKDTQHLGNHLFLLCLDSTNQNNNNPGCRRTQNHLCFYYYYFIYMIYCIKNPHKLSCYQIWSSALLQGYV